LIPALWAGVAVLAAGAFVVLVLPFRVRSSADDAVAGDAEIAAAGDGSIAVEGRRGVLAGEAA
jgi:hypothetical protein